MLGDTILPSVAIDEIDNVVEASAGTQKQPHFRFSRHNELPAEIAERLLPQNNCGLSGTGLIVAKARQLKQAEGHWEPPQSG